MAKLLCLSTVSDFYAQFYGSGSLWVDHFLMHELTQVIRQRDDSAFSELMCHVRTDSCTPDYFGILKSCEVAVDAPDYPTQVLHVYRLNADVDARNSHMLNNLAPESD